MQGDMMYLPSEAHNVHPDAIANNVAHTDIQEDRIRAIISTQTVSAPMEYTGSNQLSLDQATAPILPRAIAPFGRTERKRAHTAALYYSECFLRGIEPFLADMAAVDAQGKYDKWWINTTIHPTDHAGEKRQQREMSDSRPTESRIPSAVADRSNNRLSFRDDGLHEQNEGADHVSKRRRTSQTDETGDADTVTSANVVSVAGWHEISSTITSEVESTIGGQEVRHNSRTMQQKESPFLSHDIATIPAKISKHQLLKVKTNLVNDLRATGGDTESRKFVECLAFLEAYYRSKNWDGRGYSKRKKSSRSPFVLEGKWLTLSKPTYNECKGRTENGSFLYSLGRMAFDMFKPTNLICSIQAVFNDVRRMDPKKPIRPLRVPKKLMKEIRKGEVLLRTYDIVVAFTIEAGQNRRGVKMEATEGGEYVVPRPIKGILTNQGYAVPDPDVPNRMSIWFSGGSLEVQDEAQDLEEWKRIFDMSCAPNRDLREYANILAAKVLLGAQLPETIQEDGTMSFALNRPIGGHGSAFCDIIYLDESVRIMRGHHGSVYACTLIPDQITSNN